MKLFKYHHLFAKAFDATKREMLVSVVILIVVSLFLALGLYLAEVRVNPDFGYGDALLWNFVKYVDDPAEIGRAHV